MKGLEKIVLDWVDRHCPDGYSVNPQAVFGIVKGIIRCKGQCPCIHNEWDETTPDEHKECPCITFRTKGECHCNLYIKSPIPHRE